MQSRQQQHSPPANSYCSLPRRLMAMLYDGVILLGLLMLAAAVALPFGNIQKAALQDFWFTLWLLVVCFVYLAGCWRRHGMTVGMRAWRVKIVGFQNNELDQKVSWTSCLLRFLVGFFSIAAFGLGILWALVDRKNRCWHDIAAKTILLKLDKDMQMHQGSS